MLNVVRRLFFTSATASAESGPFDFQAFFQQGTAVALLSGGQIYLVTPSHVVRNATANEYENDSPFWVTRAHEQPYDLMDFLMPDRIFDCSPGGEDPMDVAVIEMNPVVLKGLADYLDWDDPSTFASANDDLAGCTAVVMGYPEEVNPYTYPSEDGAPIQVATFSRAAFRGVLLDTGGTHFENLSHKPDYDYAGLSGGVVVAATQSGFKYVGVVVSSFEKGKRFAIIPFLSIRQRLQELAQLEWEVVDEAYFMRRPTHSGMTYAQLREMLRKPLGPVPERSNRFLEQIERSLRGPSRSHWVVNLRLLALEAKQRVREDLVTVLSQVAREKHRSA